MLENTQETTPQGDCEQDSELMAAKLIDAAAVLEPHVDRINKSRTKVRLKDGRIDRLLFKEIAGKHTLKEDPAASEQVIYEVLTNIRLYENCWMEFTLGKLTAFKIEMRPIPTPRATAISKSRETETAVARPRLDPERLFHECDMAILDMLVSFSERDGHVPHSIALRLLVENNGRQDFAAELTRLGNVEKGAYATLTRALMKHEFVRGPFTMAVVRIKNKHGNWTHGVKVSKVLVIPM